MKRVLLILFSVYLVTTALAAGVIDLRPLVPPYWIVGTVDDVNDNGTTIKADGRYVDFYQNNDDLRNGYFAQTVITGNTFILNGFEIWPALLGVGVPYQVATERRDDNYGASSEVTVTGRGWDEVTRMRLVYGGGTGRHDRDGKTPEQAPRIKVWFGNRLYQKAIVDAGEKFIIPNNPKIRADISIDAPYSVSSRIEDYSIIVDPGTSASKTLGLSARNMTAQSYAIAGGIKAFTLQYDVSDEERLSEGPHNFNFVATSRGDIGLAAAAVETASVEVAGGPLRIIGTPLTFPTPFRIHRDTNITIQYTLSQNADINLTIYSVEGRIVKSFYCPKGTEGGSAGTNKVTWDGIREDGLRAGAGVYVGSIVGREENRLLAKFKPAIVE